MPAAPTPEQLSDEIRLQFRRAGMAYTILTRRAISGPLWIQTAHAVGFKLGRPVHTRQVGPEVRAWLRDWPRDENELALHQRRVARWRAAKLQFLSDRPGLQEGGEVAADRPGEGPGGPQVLMASNGGGEDSGLDRFPPERAVTGPADPHEGV